MSGLLRLNLRTVILLGAALFVASLFFISHVYASLTIAFVLAYLLEPVVAELEKRGLDRAWGVPLTLVLFFVALFAATMGILPKLFAQGRELIQRLPTVYYGVANALAPYSEQYLGYNVFRDVDKLL